MPTTLENNENISSISNRRGEPNEKNKKYENSINKKRKIYIQSSVPLQMTIYYHCWYDLIYAIVQISLYIWKLIAIDLDVVSKIVLPIVIIVWIIGEIIRLYFGYSGNLTERVPRVFVFLLLSIVPNLPCWIYLAALQPARSSLNISLDIFMGIFLITSIVFGWKTMRKLVRVNSFKYYYNIKADEDE